jgi:hypothetical protein
VQLFFLFVVALFVISVFVLNVETEAEIIRQRSAQLTSAKVFSYTEEIEAQESQQKTVKAAIL